MSYSRPQITAANSAINAIQSTSALKGSPYYWDNNMNDPLYHTDSATSTAYEADE